MASDGSTTDETFEVFDGEEYELLPPTNARLKSVLRLELRSTAGGTLAEKKQSARLMGWEPADVIPGHSREEKGPDGETVVRDNDLDALPMPEHYARTAEVIFEECEVDSRKDELRIDEVRRAVDTFTASVFGTRPASQT